MWNCFVGKTQGVRWNGLKNRVDRRYLVAFAGGEEEVRCWYCHRERYFPFNFLPFPGTHTCATEM